MQPDGPAPRQPALHALWHADQRDRGGEGRGGEGRGGERGGMRRGGERNVHTKDNDN